MIIQYEVIKRTNKTDMIVSVSEKRELAIRLAAYQLNKTVTDMRELIHSGKYSVTAKKLRKGINNAS